jgi:hypothetical protein
MIPRMTGADFPEGVFVSSTKYVFYHGLTHFHNSHKGQSQGNVHTFFQATDKKCLILK